MKYKDISYNLYYEEQYLPNARCKKTRTHTVSTDGFFHIPIVEDFPVACIVHEADEDVEIRYANGSFWRIHHHGYSFEAVRHNLEQRGGHGILQGSNEDLEQGYNPMTIISVSDDRKSQEAYHKKYEKMYVCYDGQLWRKIQEPYFETDFSTYGYMISATIRDIDFDTDASKPCTRRIDRNAYALRDKKLMERKMQEIVASRPHRKITIVEDSVDVLMPEVFKFGIDAETEIREKIILHLPADVCHFLSMLGDPDEDPGCFERFYKEHIADYVIQTMQEQDEPFYRMSSNTVMVATRRMLDELAKSAQQKEDVIPF